MRDTLKAWLNGTRDYTIGVSLYNAVGSNDKLKSLFSSGYTMYNNYRLQEELRLAYDRMKATKLSREIKIASAIVDTAFGVANAVRDVCDSDEPEDNPISKELWAATKYQADFHYKQAMNARAVLFSAVPATAGEFNRPDLVAARAELCLLVLSEHKKASEYYDKADYALKNGKLPDSQDIPDLAAEIAAIPDIHVKQSLDNARKARNKIKDREQTPERVQLLHNHNERIKLLEERWLCLKQKN